MAITYVKYSEHFKNVLQSNLRSLFLKLNGFYYELSPIMAHTVYSVCEYQKDPLPISFWIVCASSARLTCCSTMAISSLSELAIASLGSLSPRTMYLYVCSVSSSILDFARLLLPETRQHDSVMHSRRLRAAEAEVGL